MERDRSSRVDELIASIGITHEQIDWLDKGETKKRAVEDFSATHSYLRSHYTRILDKYYDGAQLQPIFDQGVKIIERINPWFDRLLQLSTLRFVVLFSALKRMYSVMRPGVTVMSTGVAEAVSAAFRDAEKALDVFDELGKMIEESPEEIAVNSSIDVAPLSGPNVLMKEFGDEFFIDEQQILRDRLSAARQEVEGAIDRMKVESQFSAESRRPGDIKTELMRHILLLHLSNEATKLLDQGADDKGQIGLGLVVLIEKAKDIKPVVLRARGGRGSMGEAWSLLGQISADEGQQLQRRWEAVQLQLREERERMNEPYGDKTSTDAREHAAMLRALVRHLGFWDPTSDFAGPQLELLENVLDPRPGSLFNYRDAGTR